MLTARRIASLAIFAALAAFSGCAKLAQDKARLSQTELATDSIRFTDLSVAGNIVTLKISRIDSKLPEPTRATTAEPIEFPEFATFTKNASGGLTPIPSQTKLLIPLSNAKCTDANCAALTYTLTRPGGKLADIANLKSTRVSKMNCTTRTTEPNGAEKLTYPTFENATVTTTMIGETEDSQKSFYGKVSYLLPSSGYRASLTLRNFLGRPSEIWIDQIDSSIQSDGRAVHVGTLNYTFDAENITATSTSVSLVGSDRERRLITVGCSI